MSFGFSIGDFIQVANTIHEIVVRCKAATLEFKDLSRDVVSMQIVVDAIKKYWEQQKLRGRDLPESQKEDLGELTKNCSEVIEEINTLLQRHEGLEVGTGLLRRIKWMRVVEIGPLRMRLLTRTMYLSQFNNAMASYSVEEPGLHAQARVLNTLNIINYRYQTGKRSAPAFTQTSSAELDHDGAWKEINADLEKEGLDPQSIAAEKPFIRKWIDDVILAEDAPIMGESSPDDDYSVYSAQPPPTSEGGKGEDHRSSYSEGLAISPWTPAAPTRIQTDRTLVDRSPPMKNIELHKSQTRDSRTSFSSSLEQRRLSDQPTRKKQIHASLVSLFRLDHGVSRELHHLNSWIEHIFQQLDTRQRGIFRGAVESVFIPAIEEAKPKAKQKVLNIILLETSRPGSRLDQESFVEMVFTILEALDDSVKVPEGSKAMDATDSNHESTRLAELMMYSWLLCYVNEHPTEELLPYGWRTDIKGVGTKLYSYIPHNITCHRIASPKMPKSCLSTFKFMSLIIRYCINELYHLQELWEANTEPDDKHVKSYLDGIDDVLGAAHMFDVFDPRQRSNPIPNLDELLGQAELVDLADPVFEGSMKGVPIQELRDLQRNVYRSLRSIMTFLVDLTTEEFQVKANNMQIDFGSNDERLGLLFPPEPPTQSTFRLNIERHSSRIYSDTKAWWEASTAIIHGFRPHLKPLDLLARRASEALDGSRMLGIQARSMKRCKHIVNLRSEDIFLDKFVLLTLESVADLPKGNKYFRGGPPNIGAKIMVDNIELSYKPAVRGQLNGKDIHRWNETEAFHISISPTSTLFIHIHNSKRRVDRIDEGFMGLISIDLTKLPTTLDGAAPFTLPLRNSYKPDLPAGTIKLRVHWCPLTQYVRTYQTSMTNTWARKEASDDRFYFEDLSRDEWESGARTAIFELSSNRPNPVCLKRANISIFDGGIGSPAKDSEAKTPIYELGSTQEDQGSLKNMTSNYDSAPSYQTGIKYRQGMQLPPALAERPAHNILQVEPPQDSSSEAARSQIWDIISNSNFESEKSSAGNVPTEDEEEEYMIPGGWDDHVALSDLKFQDKLSSIISRSEHTSCFIELDGRIPQFTRTELDLEPWQSLGDFVVIVGEPDAVMATTCRKYISTTWPQYAAEIIQFFNTLAFGNSLYAGHKTQLQRSHTSASVDLSLESRYPISMGRDLASEDYITKWKLECPDTKLLASLVEAVAWLSGVMYQAEEPLTQCWMGALHRNPAHCVFRITTFRKRPIDNSVLGSTASCWLPLMPRTTLSRHELFGHSKPPERELEMKGIEISFEMMCALCGLQYEMVEDDGVVLYGANSMVFPVSMVNDSIQWHFQPLENSMVEETSKAGLRPTSRDESSQPGRRLKNINLSTLVNEKRHFLGLWLNPKVTLGSDRCRVEKIWWSTADRMDQERTHDGRQVGGSFTLPRFLSMNWTETFRIARSRKSPYASDAISFLNRLHMMKNVPVVLYSIKEKRAWLVSFLNVLLHLTRARAHTQVDLEYHIPCCEAAADGGLAAFKAIQSFHQKALTPRKSNEDLTEHENDYTIEKYLLETWAALDCIKRESNKTRGLLGRPSIIGYEMADITNRRPDLHMKKHKLGESGAGWTSLLDEASFVLFYENLDDPISWNSDRTSPASSTCSTDRWRNIPSGYNLLTASLPCLKHAIQIHNVYGSWAKISPTHFWHNACPARTGSLFDSCGCALERTAVRCCKLQRVLPQPSRARLGLTWRTPVPSPPSFEELEKSQNAAVVFAYDTIPLPLPEVR